MRKNTARHWLHAALDLLPVILIPVFMIYSHRHVLTERTEVDIQYKYQSNEVNSNDDLVIGNIYRFNLTATYSADVRLLIDEIIRIDDLEYASYNMVNNSSAAQYVPYYYFLNSNFFNTKSGDTVTYYSAVSKLDMIFKYRGTNGADFPNLYTYLSYTDYNVIESVDVQDTNSDIMSVFMDDFNYTVNKYFNMGNVFNLKDVYHWFEVNIFNNNPPVVMASIYNIIVYEFVMDLLFLLYGLFMWFVDMLKRLIEKPIDSIK